MFLILDMVISHFGRSKIRVRFGFVCSSLVGKDDSAVRKQSTWSLISCQLSLLRYLLQEKKISHIIGEEKECASKLNFVLHADPCFYYSLKIASTIHKLHYLESFLSQSPLHVSWTSVALSQQFTWKPPVRCSSCLIALIILPSFPQMSMGPSFLH